ncbi:MAG: ATP-binding cassette domain-containing protein [Desulfuromonadales bacterium]|nr:ATP-binding cassette domain-containing protein [Desulfuromonadales bacterium]
MNILSLHQVSLAFGGPKLLDSVNLQIEAGDRICLLGRNGAGKSSLMRLLNGDIPADAGEIQRRQGVHTAYVPQDFPSRWPGTVRDYLLQSGQAQGIDELTLQVRIDQLAGRLELMLDEPPTDLSGGQQRRTLLAAALILEPDLILLDEPTNHLDVEAIIKLEEMLLRLGKTLVFVSHDRAFARRLATRIVELDRGRLHDYRCDYDTFLERRQDVLHAEERAWERFDQKLAEEEVWIRKGIKARRTRNMGRVRDLLKLREERRQRRERIGKVRLNIDEAQRSGRLVVETQGLSFAFDDSPALIKNLDLRIMRGDRIGLLGPNGCGKTTLLKLLTGELQPTTGTLRLGTNLEIAYFDQLRDQLDGDRSVKQNLADDHDQVIINGQPRHIYGYLQDFLFTPERARTPVRVLSGGEKNRLLLAKLFTRPANLLILDEPTNDLDMETLELLEELLLDYQGTVLLVSHDRSFINNLVTSSLVFSGNGRVEEVIGGYDDWLAQQPVLAPGTEKKAKAAAPVRKERQRKLTFKEKKELEELPLTIETLEAEQAELHQRMADPTLYQQGGSAAVTATNQRLAELEATLEKAYGRWQELEQIPE